MILAGDIGGTSTRLALFEVTGGRLKPVVEQKYPSREHQSLDEIVRLFTTQHKLPVEHACFGIAGPVENGHVKTPNLSWAESNILTNSTAERSEAASGGSDD